MTHKQCNRSQTDVGEVSNHDCDLCTFCGLGDKAKVLKQGVGRGGLDDVAGRGGHYAEGFCLGLWPVVGGLGLLVGWRG